MKVLNILLLVGSTSAVHTSVSSHHGKATDSGSWIPDRYSTGDDDQLMKNLIEQGLAYTKDPGFTDKY